MTRFGSSAKRFAYKMPNRLQTWRMNRDRLSFS